MESLLLRLIPNYLRSPRCPKCGTDDVRRSRVREREDGQQPVEGAYKRWFRCRECGCRFYARDAFLVRVALLSVFSVVAMVVALIWSYSLNLTNSGPIQGVARTAVGDADRAGSVEWDGSAVPDVFTPEGVDALLELGAEAQYQAGVRIIKNAWRNGERFKLVDGVKWIRAAAEEGHHQAQVLLGRCYENGRGVIKNYPQALEWYRRSAVAGNPVAMARLGRMLADGRGVDIDVVEAYQWLNVAAARGVVGAHRERGQVEARMSDQELVAAQEESFRLDATLPRIALGSLEIPPGF